MPPTSGLCGLCCQPARAQPAGVTQAGAEMVRTDIAAAASQGARIPSNKNLCAAPPTARLSFPDFGNI
jgi:hypothetical protein